ncbi:hypothetical protein FMM56_01560 [Campylobacter sp. LR264d]|uniref:hypothetical protein n=1 Tax=Campylobacter sp. LR264d TaxID=2593544 RepID=UPI00123B8E9B|nr:hypothetical protein [Campylobacter sp. LR264d]KAA6234153.1 hypothetical protein FMM56_01560 [Campylobacter sp. LR264d]
MKIKLFALASFIYIGFVIAFAFYLNLGDYTLNLGTLSLSLPVMLWLGVPLLIYFVFALLHISFYGFLRYLKFKHFFKDSRHFEHFVRDLLLEKESRISFTTKEFRRVAQFAKVLKTHEKIENETKINEILDLLDGLNKEEYLNINKFRLPQNNVLYIKNDKNRLKNDPDYAYSKLKNLSELKNEFDELAFEMLIKKGAYNQIKNIKIPKTPAQIISLIKRFKEGNLELSLAEFEILLSKSNLGEKEFLQVAKMCTKVFNPDAIINIFLKIKNENKEALKGYLFLLAEFSMFDELLTQIKHGDNFEDFKAVLALREKNIHFDLNQLIQ